MSADRLDGKIRVTSGEFGDCPRCGNTQGFLLTNEVGKGLAITSAVFVQCERCGVWRRIPWRKD